MVKLGLMQLGLLIWKCWKSEIRNPGRFFGDLVVPLIMFIVLAIFRVSFDLTQKQLECHFDAKPLPSAGHVPYLQGMVCLYDNACQVNKTRSEDGAYPFGQALITLMIREADTMNQKLMVSPNDLLTDGSFVRLMKEVVVAEKLFQGYGLPPDAAKQYAAVSGSWALLCDRSFNFSNPTSGQSSNSVLTSNKDASSQDGCVDFLKPFQQIKPIWNTVGPIFQGKIMYYPDTPVVRDFVQRVDGSLDWQTSFQIAVQGGMDLINQVTNTYLSLNASYVQDQLIAGGQVSEEDAYWITEFIRTSNFTELMESTLPGFIQKLDCFRPPNNSTVPVQGLNYSTPRLEGFTDAAAMVAQAMKYTENDQLFGAIEFKDPDKLNGPEMPELVRYSIRLDPTQIGTTSSYKSSPYDLNNRRDPTRGEMPYFTTGFIYLQDAIEKMVISLRTSSVYESVGAIMQQFPYPCYMIDLFIFNLSNQLLLFIVLGWIYPAAIIVKSIVLEKEQKLREMDRIMGISPGLHLLSWFIFWLSLLLISVILFVVIVWASRIIIYSNFGLIFLIMITYAISTITFSFMISSFFSKANVAAVVGGLLYFLTYFAWGGIANGAYESLDFTLMMATSVMPNAAIGFGLNIVGKQELGLVGSQLSNFNVPATDSPQDQYTLFHCWIMLVADSVFFYFVAWYIEHVYPGEYGVPKPFYFIVQPSFWFESCFKKSSSSTPASTDPNHRPETLFKSENDPAHLPLGASLDSIEKIYDFTVFEKLQFGLCGKSDALKRKAVDNLSLNMYEGQITALLGHNGAGKTTTMSIMTGLITATSGSASIDGHDVATEIDEVRRVLGFCPQFNVLYDDLTVEEHLWFYARIRGIDKSVINEDIEEMLKDTKLTFKRNEKSKVLSGGMKRRLSIAVAFIGGSKCVILDEPTAGVDPHARRFIWDLLSKFRNGRTIILSTHHMDEAEVLADRIAVMSQGKLLTCGSPLFLKETCSEGYRLAVVRKKHENGAPNEMIDKTWERQVTSFIKQHITDSSLVEHVNGELRYRLPYSNLHAFGNFFTALNSSKDELDIVDFGVSDTTLEQIFIKLSNQADSNSEKLAAQQNEAFDETHGSDKVLTAASADDNTRIEFDNEPVMPKYTPLSGFALTRQQFYALLVKRFHRTKRNLRGFVSELILPIIFVLLGVVVLQISQFETTDPPTMEVQPWLMAPSAETAADKRLYMFVDETVDGGLAGLSSNIHGAAVSSDYAGTRCMDPNVYRIPNYPCQYSSSDSAFQWSDQYRQRYCVCTSEGVQSCDETSENDPRNSGIFNNGNVQFSRLRTDDDVLNLTKIDLSRYILDEYTKLKQNLYGGLSYLNAPASLAIGKTFPSNFTTKRLISPLALTVWYNNKGYLSNVAYNNYANNMMYRLAVNDSSISKYGIVAYNQPLNYTKEEFSKQLTGAVIIDVMLAIMLILALSFIPASFVVFLIEDRISDSKHVQIVSGLRPAAYWFGNYCWDIINYMIPSLLCLAIFASFQLSAYINEKSTGVLLLLFLMYGFSVAPMLYPTSFFLDTPSTAFVVLSCVNLLIGAGTTVATWFLDLFGQTDANLESLNNILKTIFYIFPQYCLGRGLINMATQYRTAEATAYFLGKKSFLDNVTPLDWDICGSFLFALTLHLIGWFIVVLLIEYRVSIFRQCFAGSKSKTSNVSEASYGSITGSNEDPDVATEKRTVLKDADDNTNSPYTMKVKELSKVFKSRGGKLTAVNDLTFGVNHGECFGLLGVNGAGKSTTFNMLTGRLLPTSGSATIRGHDIMKSRNGANKQIGYCPQYDCITPLLTGRENLEFFARLRAVPEKFVKQVAVCYYTRLDLTRHADKRAGAYSGGNKRKLSAAIALTGDPPLIFLDEPTAGMDPRARRFLWRAIQNLLINGQSVVLTTHSMDECEALCTRLAIMVNGEFRCLGSPQRLKARFGEGYLINFRFRGNQAGDRLAAHMTGKSEAALKVLQDKFKDVRLKEAHDNVAVYSIGASGREPVPLGELFTFLTNKTNLLPLQVSEYSVMQSSLDAVFVTFAKLQSSDLVEEDNKPSPTEGADKAAPQGDDVDFF